MEQTTELALQVADVKLVAPRGQNVYEGHAVTGVYIPYQFGVFGRKRLQVVGYGELQKQVFGLTFNSERF